MRGGRGRSRRRGVFEYRNGVVRAWVGFREKLKRIVESKYFNRGIMIAILVNTLSMGIEYHEQVRIMRREANESPRQLQTDGSKLKRAVNDLQGETSSLMRTVGCPTLCVKMAFV